MRRAAGVFLTVSGTLLAAFSLLVGASFSAIYIIGFVGTGGREAGGELGGMVLMTITGFGIGFAVMRLGRRMTATLEPNQEDLHSNGKQP